MLGVGLSWLLLPPSPWEQDQAGSHHHDHHDPAEALICAPLSIPCRRRDPARSSETLNLNLLPGPRGLRDQEMPEGRQSGTLPCSHCRLHHGPGCRSLAGGGAGGWMLAVASVGHQEDTAQAGH